MSGNRRHPRMSETSHATAPAPCQPRQAGAQRRDRSGDALPAELHAHLGRIRPCRARSSIPAAISTASRRAIAEVGMKPEKILLTHGHIDHAGGAAELRERAAACRSRGRTRPTSVRCSTALARAGRRPTAWRRAPVTPDRWLAEGDTVTIAGHTFEVLHCPGHSPGIGGARQPRRSALRWWATCCSRARSAAPTCRAATTRR